MLFILCMRVSSILYINACIYKRYGLYIYIYAISIPQPFAADFLLKMAISSKMMVEFILLDDIMRKECFVN